MIGEHGVALAYMNGEIPSNWMFGRILDLEGVFSFEEPSGSTPFLN
jgi:hypothetical protein